jgi:hypothetical protein
MRGLRPRPSRLQQIVLHGRLGKRRGGDTLTPFRAARRFRSFRRNIRGSRVSQALSGSARAGASRVEDATKPPQGFSPPDTIARASDVGAFAVVRDVGDLRLRNLRISNPAAGRGERAGRAPHLSGAAGDADAGVAAKQRRGRSFEPVAIGPDGHSPAAFSGSLDQDLRLDRVFCPYGLVDRWIPRPKILHPYPNERFYAKHPK